MPTYGEQQKPAGVKLPCGCKPIGDRKMISRNKNVTSTLRIDNPSYGGNGALNAQR